MKKSSEPGCLIYQCRVEEELHSPVIHSLAKMSAKTSCKNDFFSFRNVNRIQIIKHPFTLPLFLRSTFV